MFYTFDFHYKQLLKNYDNFKIGCSDRDVERDHIFNIDISLHSYFNVELNIA